MAETIQEERRLLTVPGLGMASANLLRLVRLSAPNWFKIPGSISVSCLVSACPIIVKVLAAKEAWTFGLLKWITVPWFVNIFTYSQKKNNALGMKPIRQPYQSRQQCIFNRPTIFCRLCIVYWHFSSKVAAIPPQYQRYC